MQTAALARCIGSAERYMRALLERGLKSASISFDEWTVMAFTSASTLDSEQVIQRQIESHLATDASEARESISTLISARVITISPGGTLVHTELGAALFVCLSREIGGIRRILYENLPDADLEATHRTLMEITKRASDLLGGEPHAYHDHAEVQTHTA